MPEDKRLRWYPPTLTKEFVCKNCDADTDDGEWRARHSADIWCVHWEE